MPCCNHNITIHCLVQIFYSALDVTNIFPAFSFVFHTIMTKWVRHCIIHLFWPKILIKKLPFFNLNILKLILFDEEGKFVLNFSKKKFQPLLFLFEWQVRKVNQPKGNTLGVLWKGNLLRFISTRKTQILVSLQLQLRSHAQRKLDISHWYLLCSSKDAATW